MIHQYKSDIFLQFFLEIRQFVTSSNVLRKGSLQTKLNAGLSEQQQEDLFQNERSFHEVKL